MSSKRTRDLPARLEGLRRRFEDWRRTRKVRTRIPDRLGKSAHVQQPTNIEVRQVSLEQLVRFLQELASFESGLQVTSLRLTAPRVASEGRQSEIWSVEVVLTQLVYSPEYAPRQS